ncbi:MAG: lysophospholipid acyltransferase family protein [Rhodospirillaceae bacterium]
MSMLKSRVDTFSYAAESQNAAQRLLIRMIERSTGQPKLKRLYMHNRAHPEPGESFWDAALRLLRLRVKITTGSMDIIPAEGPAVIVANHPYGVLDGITLSWLVSQRRQDFQVLTNAVLRRAEEIRPWLLPIDFAPTREAQAINLDTRRAADRLLGDGGVLVVFPGGAVSYTAKPFTRQAADPVWKPFTAKLIEKHKPPIIPIYFHGQNSRLFQLASHVSMTLRLSLLFREVARRMDGEIALGIGQPIPVEELQACGGRQAMMDELRRRTYAVGLSPEKIPPVPPEPRGFGPHRNKDADKGPAKLPAPKLPTPKLTDKAPSGQAAKASRG